MKRIAAASPSYKGKGILTGLLLVTLLLGVVDAQAQARREKPKPKSWMDKYWLGGNFGLGFAGNQNVSQFNLGVFPMVGYKVLPWFSLGPRLGVDYNYYKAPSASPSGGFASTNIFSFYGGAFLRAKVFRTFFVQTEYGIDSGRFPVIDPFGRLEVDSDNKVIKVRDTREFGMVGLGYNSGGLIASEILILYNLLEPDDSPYNPFNLRFGLTYRF